MQDAYKFGDLKRDPATRSVAIRTTNAGVMAWLVSNPNGLTGSHWAPFTEVEEWPDLGPY